jgi:hypothetical protein
MGQKKASHPPESPQRGDIGIEKIEGEEKRLALALKIVDFLLEQRKEKGKWK